jgi:hypothetical protein
MGHNHIMKPLNLLCALGLFILSVFSSYAQDVIVKTDGSAVVCKVLSIDNSYVQFKKYSNLNGPTYTVSIADVSTITYENGERETFGKKSTSTATNNTKQNRRKQPNQSNSKVQETPLAFTSTSNPNVSDAELYQWYSHKNKYNYTTAQKLNKTAKVGAIIIGAGGLTATTIVLLCEIGYADDAYEDDAFYGGTYATAGATIACTGLWYWGFKSAAKRAEKKESYRSEFKLPSNPEKNFTAGIDILNDRTTAGSTLGLGLKYSF